MQLALGIVGAAIGSLFGAPQIGFLIGSMIGGLLDPPKQEGPRLNDLKVQTSTYGKMFPFIWGTGRIAGDMIDQTDLVEHKQKSGGKGGPQVTNYTYSSSFDIALAAAKRFGDPACLGILRIWADARLIWTSTDGTPMPCTFYSGLEDQLPDPTFEAIHGVGSVPAYRGLAHVVFADYFLTDFGNHIPSLEFEVYTGDGDYPWQVSLGREPGAYSYSYNDGVITAIRAEVFSGYMDVHVSTFDIDMNRLTGPVLTTIPNAGVEGSNINGVDQIFTSLYGIGWWAPNPVGIMIQTSADISVEWLASNNGTSGGNFGVSQDGIYYSFRSVAPTYINSWTPGGGHDQQALIGAFHSNTCDLGTSDTSHIYVFHTSVGASDLYKYDSDLNLVYHWDNAQILADLGVLHPLYSGGTRGNFFVYKDQIAFNKQVGTNAWIHLVNIGPAPTYTLSDDPTHELAQSSVGRISHLSGGLCMNISVGVFSLDPPAGPELLSTIVGDLSDMTPAAGAYDVSELTDEVRWFVIASQMPVRNAVQSLRQSFFFDAVESDDQIKFIKNSEVVQFSIPDDDLEGRAYGEEPEDPLSTRRQREQELPRKVTFDYIDVDLDYQPGSQLAQRQTTLSQQDVSVQVPVGFTSDEAKQRAETLLTKTWLEREGFEWSTTRKWAHLEPCMVGIVRGRVIRIHTRVESPNGVIKWTGVLAAPSQFTSAESSIYYQTAPGAPSPGHVTPDPPAARTTTDLILFDMALVGDAASPNGYPAAATAHSNAGTWSGYELFKSSDGGTTYNSVGSSLVPDVLGTVASSLGDFQGGNVFDWSHKITVVIYSKDGELESYTRTAVLNGAGMFALGSPSAGYEFLQYMNATLISTNTYELTGLLRGRRGTEWAMSGHGIDETFVMLPTTVDVAGPIGELNASRKFKPVTFGNTLTDATAQDFTNTGVALKPYSPVHLAGGRNGSGDAVFSWRRRTRLGAAWFDGVDLPLGEDSEVYLFTLYTSGTYLTSIGYEDIPVIGAQTLTISNLELGSIYGSPLPSTGYWGVKQQGTYRNGYESFGTF